jgi:hypothetical protein
MGLIRRPATYTFSVPNGSAFVPYQRIWFGTPRSSPSIPIALPNQFIFCSLQPPAIFTLTAVSNSATTIAGGAATYSLTLSPASGTIPDAVTFSATGLPAGATATFSPGGPGIPAAVVRGHEIRTHAVAADIVLTIAAGRGSVVGRSAGPERLQRQWWFFLQPPCHELHRGSDRNGCHQKRREFDQPHAHRKVTSGSFSPR